MGSRPVQAMRKICCGLRWRGLAGSRRGRRRARQQPKPSAGARPVPHPSRVEDPSRAWRRPKPARPGAGGKDLLTSIKRARELDRRRLGRSELRRSQRRAEAEPKAGRAEAKPAARRSSRPRKTAEKASGDQATGSKHPVNRPRSSRPSRSHAPTERTAAALVRRSLGNPVTAWRPPALVSQPELLASRSREAETSATRARMTVEEVDDDEWPED